MKYSVIGDETAIEFFYIDADSGIITLRKLFTEGTQEQYNVRLTFSLRVCFLCPILSHRDCGITYVKPNGTLKYFIKKPSKYNLYLDMKYESCYVMNPCLPLMLQ